MSRGYVLYAFNTPHCDYVKMAAYNARLIHIHTGYPVALVTDTESSVRAGDFDHVIRKEPNIVSDNYGVDRKLWRNTERTGYLEDSPFSRSVVLDVDYLIYNDQTNLLLESSEPLILSRNVRQVSDVHMEESRVSLFGLDTIWATCFAFEPSQRAVDFFNLVEYVREHYPYFAQLYDFSPKPFRNDFAFTIAHHLMSGNDPKNTEIMINPFKIFIINRRDKVLKLYDDGVMAEDSHSGVGYIRTRGMNVHVLSKASLNQCIYALEYEKESSHATF